MEELFELLAGTNNTVTIKLDNIATVTGEIVSVEKFIDGLKLYFDNDSEYFISSVYNGVLDKFVASNIIVYQLFDTIHNLSLDITILDE